MKRTTIIRTMVAAFAAAIAMSACAPPAPVGETGPSFGPDWCSAEDLRSHDPACPPGSGDLAHTCTDGREIRHVIDTWYMVDGVPIELDPGPGEFPALCGDPL